MPRRPKLSEPLDTELSDLAPEQRWRTWMGRVEAVIFAAPEPVDRETLRRVVGAECKLELLIDDIRAELVDRPYELVAVAGGWQHRTRKSFAAAIQEATGLGEKARALTPTESLVLTAVGYFQPVTRGELGKILGREISRDLMASLRALGLIAAGPRSPEPGAPYTYVTTKQFLTQFGLKSLRDLPDTEMLEDAGFLSQANLLQAAELEEVDLRSDESGDDEADVA